MAEEFKVLGKPFLLKNGRQLLTGTGLFAADRQFGPTMLVGKTLSCPYAHARVVSIDTSKAEALPGVRAVITYKDAEIQGKATGFLQGSHPILIEKPRTYLECIALVAATDEDIAIEAISLIDVEYEQLPVLVDARDAMEPGAYPIDEGGNIVEDLITAEWGDVEEGFKESDYIMEFDYFCQQVAHLPMEVQTCAAFWENDDHVTVVCNGQDNWGVRDEVARNQPLPKGQVRVVNDYGGGGFGNYYAENIGNLVAFLAKKAGQPVRMIYERPETMMKVGQGRVPIHTHQKLGFNSDGSIVSQYTEELNNCGAYMNSVAATLILHDVMFKIKNSRSRRIGVRTNAHRYGRPMRGIGTVPALWLENTTGDRIAEKVGMDPVDWHLQNFEHMYKPRAIPPVPLAEVTSVGIDECIIKGAEAIGWEAKWKGWGIPMAVDGPRRRGIGMAVLKYQWGFFPARCCATVRIQTDGSVNLVVGVNNPGTTPETSQAAVCAETLGVPFEDVTVRTGDTNLVHEGCVANASRTAATAGWATLNAASECKQRLLAQASEMLNEPIEDLEAEDGKIYVAGVEKSTVADVAGWAGTAPRYRSIVGTGHPPDVPEMNRSHTFAAQFAEVEVDTETGQVTVLDVVAAHDVGRALNKAIVEGQICGAFIQISGMARFEEQVMDKASGVLLNGNLLNYKIATMLDAPLSITPIMVEPTDPDPYCPYGAKGMGEPAGVPASPAITNAIYNAIGVRVDELPATPDKILKALGKI